MRAVTKPVRISPDQTMEPLSRISAGDAQYSENWLQELLDRHPEVLPVSEIEPAFEYVISAGREISCAHGYIDNLFLTGGGDIVLVETKLHANAQARREVVAQTLDYLSALVSMDFTQFEQIVCAAQHRGERPRCLYDLVRHVPEALDECRFFDAVSANLRRGRVLALVVGDGVRREAETLTGILQSHAGSHFTFALVELALYRASDDSILVVPSILAKTHMIERAVVRIIDDTGRLAVEKVPAQETAPKPRGLTELKFDEEMEKRQPGLARHIRDFIVSLEPMGVYAEMLGSLNLKVEVGRERPANLGFIQKNGQVWTSSLALAMPQEPSLRYNEELARHIGGKVAYASERELYVSTNGKSAPRIEDLLPAHADAWREAIRDLIAELRV